MTFRTVDLQMSIPRTQELSGTHGQAIQRPVSEQDLLAKEAAKHTEELRTKNVAVDQPASLSIQKDNEQMQHGGKRRKKRSDQDSEETDGEDKQPPSHPYKGHHFDIKL